MPASFSPPRHRLAVPTVGIRLAGAGMDLEIEIGSDFWKIGGDGSPRVTPR
jgi:hypothetical protein